MTSVESFKASDGLKILRGCALSCLQQSAQLSGLSGHKVESLRTLGIPIWGCFTIFQPDAPMWAVCASKYLNSKESLMVTEHFQIAWGIVV